MLYFNHPSVAPLVDENGHLRRRGDTLRDVLDNALSVGSGKVATTAEGAVGEQGRLVASEREIVGEAARLLAQAAEMLAQIAGGSDGDG